MAKKLTYFDLPGVAEGIRYILHYTGQKFEDYRLDYSTWPDKEIKDSLPFGQLPIFQEGDRVLNQSLAIGRYLATNTVLMPSDLWEQAVLDATAYTIYDYHKNVTTIFPETDPVRKEQLLKIFFGETLDFFFSRFEKQLKANNGYLGKQLSWVDFVFVGIVETSNIVFKTNIEKDYTAVAELINKVHNLPGIKEYLKTRTHYVL